MTYNLGGQQPQAAKDIISTFFQKKEFPDVCVFGFQEMKGHYQLNHHYDNSYHEPFVHNACQGVSKSFNLCLIIYVKRPIKVEKVEDKKYVHDLGIIIGNIMEAKEFKMLY